MNAPEQDPVHSPRRSAAWAWLTCALVLGLAVALQGLGAWREVPPARAPHLAAAVPEHAGDWTSHEVPLGPNEFLASEAEKILRFDDVLNRRYVCGGEQFDVYVAYWGPGKMPTQLVAAHTPDRCWTENGWHCLEQRHRQPSPVANLSLQPAEWRLFEPPEGGQTLHVLYWHLVDGRAQDFGERFNAVPDPVQWWRGVVQEALQGRREQYFVRVSGTVPLEQLAEDAGFRAVMAALADLGLEAAPVQP